MHSADATGGASLAQRQSGNGRRWVTSVRSVFTHGSSGGYVRAKTQVGSFQGWPSISRASGMLGEEGGEGTRGGRRSRGLRAWGGDGEGERGLSRAFEVEVDDAALWVLGDKDGDAGVVWGEGGDEDIGGLGAVGRRGGGRRGAPGEEQEEGPAAHGSGRGVLEGLDAGEEIALGDDLEGSPGGDELFGGLLLGALFPVGFVVADDEVGGVF